MRHENEWCFPSKILKIKLPIECSHVRTQLGQNSMIFLNVLNSVQGEFILNNGFRKNDGT